jgi:FO synthase
MVAGIALLSDDDALRIADGAALGAAEREAVQQAARDVRDRAWGRRITFSPKVFLPLTNLCRNRCRYCSFRRSPGDAGAWTMTPAEVTGWVDRARDAGCAEALFCLGDKPEGVFASYREELASWGHAGTVDYLVEAGRVALERGLLPHTNAGLLTREDMTRLKEVNVSLGLMLESASARLCEPGMPHAHAPDKRPEKRLAMIAEAGELQIPFTTGILIGIGETPRERVEALIAIRDLHRAHGHVQEVIVQNFRAHESTFMRNHPEPTDAEIAHTVSLARLILDEDVSVQAPPNLNAESTAQLFAAGVNDLGGISPVTPDYINPCHPWPHLERLAETCAADGYTLAPRMPIYDRYVDRPGFLDARLLEPTRAVAARLARVTKPSDLAPARARTNASATSATKTTDGDTERRAAS